MPARSGFLFHDRVQAGSELGEALCAFQDRKPIVLGIPRGGVPVAAEVARALEAPLGVVVARKLGAPGRPELAIGAVTANGGRFLDEETIRYLDVPQEYIEAATVRERAEARRREERFQSGRPLPSLTGRMVILVDDGLATGSTMRAAVRSVRKQQPDWLVVAVPVGSREACEALRREADQVVCLSEPEYFGAVGNFYLSFPQTEDSEVLEILSDAAVERAPAAS